jgi:hypothetical protein
MRNPPTATLRAPSKPARARRTLRALERATFRSARPAFGGSARTLPRPARLPATPRLVLALAPALALLATTACGGGGDTGSTDAGAASSGTSTTATDSQSGGSGGTTSLSSSSSSASSGGGGSTGQGGSGGGGGPAGCAGDLDCPCGEVCAGGTCGPSDCASSFCLGEDKGRVCKCEGGIFDIDGKTGAQWPQADVLLRKRPFVAADDGTDLLLRNYHVHDATDMKGVHVTTCSAEGWQYKSVTLSCLEVNDVFRDAAGQQAGLHMDYIKLDGCSSAAPTAVLLQDIDVHDGNVYSLFSDTRLSSLTLRRMKHVNTEGAVQIGTLSQPDKPDAGYFDEVHIEESPDLHVALLGSKIGVVYVKASPGVTGGDGTAAPVIYDAVSCPDRPLEANECCTSDSETCM